MYIINLILGIAVMAASLLAYGLENQYLGAFSLPLSFVFVAVAGYFLLTAQDVRMSAGPRNK